MKVGIIRPEELANKMEDPSKSLVIVDCRSGMEYLTWHISGAFNIGGTRNTRREIMTGRVTVLSVLHDQIGRNCNKEELMVVYDQCSVESSSVQSLAGRVADELALYFKRVCFLRGGFIGFQSKYPNLCWTNKHKLPDEDFVTPSQTGCAGSQSSHESPSVRPLVGVGSQSLTRSHTMITLATSQSQLDSSLASIVQHPSPVSIHPTIVPRHSLSGPALPSSKEGPTTVLSYLLLGTQQDALNQACILKHGITHVINVSTDGMMCPYVLPSNFIRIPVLDNFADKITQYFPMAFQFLDDVKTMGGRALVHCSAGISRSPTLAIGYLMKTMTISVTEAYNIVKSSRVSVSPNFNFMGQLTDYEKLLRSSMIVDECATSSLSSGSAGASVAKTGRQKRRPSRLGFLSNLLRYRISTSPTRDIATTTSTNTLSVCKTPTPLLPSPSVPFARLGINSPMEESPASFRLDNFPATSLDQLHFQPCQTGGPRGVKCKRSATQADNDSSKIRKRLPSNLDSIATSSVMEPDSSSSHSVMRRHSSVFPPTTSATVAAMTTDYSPSDCSLDKPLCLSGRSVSYERVNMIGSSNGSGPSNNNNCSTPTILTDSCRLQECHQSTSSLSSANSHSSNLLV